jgi:GAF domain-containing protein
MRARLPEDEPGRLESLRRYQILDTDYEEAFDTAARLAAHICQTPTALITFVDEHRQWFKSHFGFAQRETSRDVSFCAHAILVEGPTVVRDALDDARFRDNPYVTTAPYIRFYAGAPLVSSEGHRLGTLCVIDRVPRELRHDQIEALQMLSTVLMALLNTRRDLRYVAGSLEDKRRRISHLEERLRQHESVAPHQTDAPN